MPSTDVEAARTAFRNKYGDVTYCVVNLLSRGYSKTAVAKITGLPDSSVAAYAANLTRGTYDSVLTQCDFRPRWNRTTRRIVSMLRDNSTPHEIARAMHMRRSKVAAYAANFTRGAYDFMA
jgi:hypothetical protein